MPDTAIGFPGHGALVVAGAACGHDPDEAARIALDQVLDDSSPTATGRLVSAAHGQITAHVIPPWRRELSEWAPPVEVVDAAAGALGSLGVVGDA
ncbi:hypothetical protein BBK14_33870 [Parafrankia soli]|uniref:Uncharacterized protein n=1 Tax=Parafrankia soli TaxID=2599596 RepID=A0A1S1QEK1_9ACTN|nr:hypothetical protein BBK14_33870 [Parafrankia soli]